MPPASAFGKASPAAPAQSGSKLGGLSASELDTRRRALEFAKNQEIEEEKIRQEAAARELEREVHSKTKLEEESKFEGEKKVEDKAEVRKPPVAPSSQPAPLRPDELTAKTVAVLEGDKKIKVLKPFERKNTEEAPKPSKPKGDDDRRRQKLTLSNALDEDRGKRGPSLAALRRRQEKAKRAANQQTGPREKISREVILPETITIQELAQRMSERAVDVVKFMMKQEQMLTHSDIVDADTAELISHEFGHTVRRVTESDIEEGLFDAPDDPADLVSRPPVVTIMAMLITAKPLCLIQFATLKWWMGKRAVLPSILVHIRLRKTARKFRLLTPLATRPSPPCARAGHKQPISPF